MKKYLIGLLAVALFTTCTHSTIQQQARQNASESTLEAPSGFGIESSPIPQQTDQEVIISSDAELRYALDELIIKGQLSEEQKSALYDIRVEIGQKLEQNSVMNVKLRSMMVDELMSEDGSQQGAYMISDMIHRNLMERMKLMEDSINKVNTVLGFEPRQQEPSQLMSTQNNFF